MIQKNRNAFIDHSELAEYIWGVHNGENWSLTTTAVDDVKIKFSISPNPVRDQLEIQSEDQHLSCSIYNLSGQVLLESDLN